MNDQLVRVAIALFRGVLILLALLAFGGICLGLGWTAFAIFGPTLGPFVLISTILLIAAFLITYITVSEEDVKNRRFF